MKKNKKKKIFIILGTLIVLIALIVGYIKVNSNSKELSLSEKKWIEENKKSMIDIYVMNNLPIFSSGEKDIFLSFLVVWHTIIVISLFLDL